MPAWRECGNARGLGVERFSGTWRSQLEGADVSF